VAAHAGGGDGVVCRAIPGVTLAGEGAAGVRGISHGQWRLILHANYCGPPYEESRRAMQR
jgi:hypothetical protein